MTDPSPPTSLALAGMCALALIALTGWAAVGRLDVVSAALGEVAPASRVKAIQHLEGGIVAAILVEEGQSVRKGEVMFRLDPTRAAAETEALEQQVLTQKINIARLTAETEDREPVFGPELEGNLQVAAARDLFVTHRRRVDGELAAVLSQITQKEQELEELQVRLRNNRKTLDIVAAQVAISQGLLSKDLVSRMTHLDLLRQQQGLRTGIETDEATRPRLDAALSEARARLASIRDNFGERARLELATARQQYNEMSQRLLRVRDIEERTAVRAPVDGVVKTVQVATEGGVIQPGQTLAELVPAEDRLVVEARLPLADIGYVLVGQPVALTLTTPDAAAYGQLRGEVRRISPDAIAGTDNRPYYRIRVVTETAWFERNRQRYQLYPGMPVLCSIQIGSRTVLDYLLGPWFNMMRFSFREK